MQLEESLEITYGHSCKSALSFNKEYHMEPRTYRRIRMIMVILIVIAALLAVSYFLIYYCFYCKKCPFSIYLLCYLPTHIPMRKSIRNMVIIVVLWTCTFIHPRFLQRQFDKQEELLGTYNNVGWLFEIRRENQLRLANKEHFPHHHQK